ncbi:MAG: transporter [Bacteroidales bacterium]
MKRFFPFLLIFCVLISEILAQDDQSHETTLNNLPSAIITDRPTVAVSPYLVPKGKFQIETGFVFENESNTTDNIKRFGIAGTLIRYSIFENFEVRAASYYGMEQVSPIETTPDSSISGFGPLTLGFKTHIVEEKAWRPQMAVVVNMTLRHLGNEYFAPIYSFPDASFLIGYTLGKFAIVGNAGFSYNGSNPDGFFIYRAAFSYNILPELAIFVEPYGNFDHGDLPNHKVDAGFTYIVRNNLLIDISAGLGLSQTNDKSFAAAGLAWRIPR